MMLLWPGQWGMKLRSIEAIGHSLINARGLEGLLKEHYGWPGVN